MVGPHDEQQSNAGRYLIVAVVTVLVIGYGMALLVTRDQWSGGADTAATAVTFDAAAPDGLRPSSADLDTTRELLERRLEASGLNGATVAVDGDTVTVTAPGDGADIERIAATRGQFALRPVLHSLPAVQVPPTSGAPSKASDEKKLRQSTDSTMQMLALQFQAERCGQPDGLAGADELDRPLITCARDGSEVFLLDAAAAAGDEVSDATVVPDGDGYAVEVTSTADAGPGGKLAAVLDTAVVGVADAQETGVMRITGLSEQDARGLAATLTGGELPLTLAAKGSTPATLPGHSSSAVRTGLMIAGAVVGAAVLGAVIYLVATRRRVRPPT